MTEEIHYFGRRMSLNDMTSVWIPQYQADRYLSNISEDELVDRLADITQNLYKFDEKQQKYQCNYHVDSNGIYKPVRNLDWLKMLTDVDEEIRIRRLENLELPSLAPTLACERRLSKSDWARRPDLIEASKPSLETYEIPNRLFRYSKKQHNENLMSLGQLRIAPASTYNDGTLNRARRDNELIMEVAEAGENFETDDFYTICFSSIYSYRNYCEFDNSCVVINDVGEFQSRFNKTIREYNKTSKGLKISEVKACPIYYYDPFNIKSPTTVDEIFLTKPFRFAYQHEFRLVVLPTKPQPLDVFFLELGPLDDIAELVCES